MTCQTIFSCERILGILFCVARGKVGSQSPGIKHTRFRENRDDQVLDVSGIALRACLIGAASITPGRSPLRIYLTQPARCVSVTARQRGEDLFRFSLGIDPQTGDIVPCIGNGRFESVDGDVVILVPPATSTRRSAWP